MTRRERSLPYHFAFATIFVLGLAAPQVRGQPAERLSLGFGLDTTKADVRSIVRLLAAYVARAGKAPSPDPLWLEAEQHTRRHDLAASFVFQGFPATLVAVIPANAANDEYVVKLLFAQADARHAVRPLAIERLYAVRQGGDFRLSGALPRLTHEWETERSGRIRYHYAPGLKPDAGKREQAAVFVDSVARLFDLPPPPRLDYYVTASTEEYHRILGLDFFVLPSGPDEGRGGQAIPEADIVLSGDPQQGEAYRHELVHSVLQRHTDGTRWNADVMEGMATWLGGSRGRPASAMTLLLREYQRRHGQITLRELLTGETSLGWRKEESDALAATRALMVGTALAVGGVRGMRALLTTSPGTDATLAAINLVRPQSTKDAEQWWRTYRVDQRVRSVP